MGSDGVSRRRRWPFIAAAVGVLLAAGAFVALIVVFEPPDSLAELKALPVYSGAQTATYLKVGVDSDGRDTSVLTFLTPDPPASVIDHYEKVLNYPGKRLISPDRRVMNLFAIVTSHHDIRFKGFESGFPWFGPMYTTKMVDVNVFTTEERIDGRDMTNVSIRYQLARIK